MRTVIVTGGRNFSDEIWLTDILDFLSPKLIVQGGATGADQLALNWANLNRVKSCTINANWDLHGRSAGPIRNIEMLEKFPNAVVVAFPGGKGTANCIKEAIARNMLVLEAK